MSTSKEKERREKHQRRKRQRNKETNQFKGGREEKRKEDKKNFVCRHTQNYFFCRPSKFSLRGRKVFWQNIFWHLLKFLAFGHFFQPCLWPTICWRKISFSSFSLSCKMAEDSVWFPFFFSFLCNFFSFGFTGYEWWSQTEKNRRRGNIKKSFHGEYFITFFVGGIVSKTKSK